MGEGHNTTNTGDGTMRRFQIIRRQTTEAQLTEVYTYNGVFKTFTGPTCVSDALRFMRKVCRICGDQFEFEILTEREVVAK